MMKSRTSRRLRSGTIAVGLLLVALMLGGIASIRRETVQVENNLSISSLAPRNLPIGSDSQKLTIGGSGFSPFSTVTLNGGGHALTFMNSSHISVLLRREELSTIGDISVIVRNGRAAAVGHLRVQGGTLRVAIRGLPAEEPGSVYVNSPDGFGRVVSATEALEVPPGTYFVVANRAGRGGVGYDADPDPQTVTITDGRSVSLEVVYDKVATSSDRANDPRISPSLRWVIPSEGD